MKKTLTCLLICCWWTWAGAQTTFLNEDFSTGSGTTPPTGWSQGQLYTTAPANDFWRFDNPGARTPGGNFSGGFAIFDSDNYSADAVYENIAVTSPVFSTQGHDSVYLVYDYRMFAGGTAEGSVEVFNGSAWVLAKQYPNVSTNATRDTIDISALGRNNCGTQVRFRWASNSGGAFCVDNVKVFSYSNGKNQNVSVKGIEAPLEGACGNGATTVKVRVKNDGLAGASSFPVTFSLFDGNITQTITQMVTSTIATCKDSLITFTSTVNMSYDSNFRIVVYTGLAGDQQLANSDTFRVNSLHITQSPIFPTPLNKLVCGIGPFKDSVQVGSGDNAFWYNKMADVNPVTTGPYYNITPLNRDSTYYVETYRFKRDRYPVPNLNPLVGFNLVSSGLYVDVIAKADIVLDSMEVRTRTAVGSNFSYVINVRKGTYVPYITTSTGWTQVVNTTVTVSATTFKIWVGSLKINAGDTVGIYLFNTGTNTIEFTSGPIIRENNALKYSSNNVNAQVLFGGTQLANFGYGGTFYYTRPCYSPRVARNLQVKPRPKGSLVIEGTPFEGSFMNGTQSIPDVVAAGDEINYEITPPTGYTNAGYGTTWQFSGITVMTTKGTAVPAADYTTTLPSGSVNGKLKFIPSGAFTDSMIVVRLTVMDMGSGNCDSVVTRYIIVAPKGDPGFMIPSSICAGQEAEFLNTSSVSSGSLMQKWYFGDGDSSYDISPLHAFALPGTYNVRLVITTSPYGYVTDTVATITVKAVPAVDFKVLNACDGDSVGFINNTTSSGTPTYLWNFGDGNTSTDEDAAHVYSQIGTYNAMLTVSLNGCNVSKTKQAIQFPMPVADFSANVTCIAGEVPFTNMSSITSGQLGYYWDFGDGTYETTINPSHDFGLTSSITVKLITTSEFGCKDTAEKNLSIMLAPQVDFSSSMACSVDPTLFTNLTTEPAGVTVSYTWYFGDGDSAKVKDAQHLYGTLGTKTVTLKAHGNNGCDQQISKDITVLIQPEADFIVSDGCSGKVFNFDNNTSISNGSKMTYSWIFGDGNTSDEISPEHTYNVASTTTYNAKLVVEAAGGCRDSVTKSVTVNYTPNCDFTITNKGNRIYSFVPSQTNDLTYDWSFGDGGTSAQQAPEYQYPAFMNYPVVLKATTVSGNCICEMQKVLSVNLSTDPKDQAAFISLYPNPSSGKLVVNVDGNYAGNVDMNVFNIVGEKVRSLDTRQFKGGAFEADLTDLANGVYLLQVNAPGKTVQTLRFTIHK